MKKRKFGVGECSHVIDPRLSEGVGDDLALESKHKIFLSHSGVQKEFVEHLCQALEDRCHYPFFDRRIESLPKGKEFPNLIVKATQQCQLFVVVVSEEYFMSKWPMIELNTFMQAKKEMKSNVDMDILPLFYGLSVSDLKDEKRRQRWLETWEKFAKDDPIERRIKVEDWCYALNELMKFNGLSYDRELKEIIAYEHEIVSHICKLVPPDIKWNDSHVQGNAHEVLFDKMDQIGLLQKFKVKVVGIYGVGGIGKTTTCKTLCNELSSKYGGRVCHVEFESKCSNSKELWQKAVMKLIRKSTDFVHQLDEGECGSVLYKDLSNQRTFLAIDNVWDDDNSIKQAKKFLLIPSHEDSLVVVTARSQSTLALLGIDGDVCLEMPELGRADATRLFLYYATDGEDFTSREDMRSIEWCVEKCYFCKGDGRSYHYHPLALEALGRQLGCLEESPSKWVQYLSRVWKLSSFSGEKVVFDVLQSSFDLLRPIEQSLFMDLGVFLPRTKEPLSGIWSHWIGWMEQLCVLYKMDEYEIQSQIESLKRKGLMQDVDLTSGKIDMHDLYHEFLTLEAIGRFGATIDMWDRKWMLLNIEDMDLSELEVTPAGRCWQKLSRLCIRQRVAEMWYALPPSYRPPIHPLTTLEGIEWQHFSNVLVLQLYGLKSVQGNLNLKGMTCLRSLQLYDFRCLERLEGLESLKHLTYFDWHIDCQAPATTIKTHVVDQFPASLKYLHIVKQCLLSESNVFLHCSNLIKLYLESMEVGILLDLSNYSSLEVVELSDLKSLQTLLGLNAKGASTLYALEVSFIIGIHIPGLDQLNGLVRLDMCGCGNSWEVPCLLSLTKLQALRIGTHAKCAEHCTPHQLQELYYKAWTQRKAPCLNAFKKLQVLDFSRSFSLTQMCGMCDLPALQSLNLYRCKSLERLPDLSKSRSLEELNLDGCEGLKLHGEDFAMLATLPFLHPVQFANFGELKWIRLDIIRLKFLLYKRFSYGDPISWLAWKEGEWEELEVGIPPIGIGNRGIWDNYVLVEYEDLKEYKGLEESDMEDLEDVDSSMDDTEFGEEDFESERKDIADEEDIEFGMEDN